MCVYVCLCVAVAEGGKLLAPLALCIVEEGRNDDDPCGRGGDWQEEEDGSGAGRDRFGVAVFRAKLGGGELLQGDAVGREGRGRVHLHHGAK